MNITEIEAITEEQAKELCTTMEEIKGHTIYFVDLGGHFKYSYLVFRNGRQIYYANDYELHHTSITDREKLYEYYINSINRKLFMDDEMDIVVDYDDYTRKGYFLRNYWPMAYERHSIFSKEPKPKRWYFNRIGFCYMPDIEVIKENAKLMRRLEKAKATKDNDFEYWVNAFVSEMYNHEYAINLQADHDTLSAFGNIEWHDNDILKYFDELKFNDTQRKAYITARQRYYKESENLY